MTDGRVAGSEPELVGPPGAGEVGDPASSPPKSRIRRRDAPASGPVPIDRAPVIRPTLETEPDLLQRQVGDRAVVYLSMRALMMITDHASTSRDEVGGF